MTVFYCEGFESVGDSGTADLDFESRIDATDSQEWRTANTPPTSGLEVDFEGQGYAWANGLFDGSDSQHLAIEFPTAFRSTSSAASKTYCCGFRYYNGEINAAFGIKERTLFYTTQGSSLPGSTLANMKVSEDQLDLIFTPSGSSSSTATGVLSVNTWHYIEIEWKGTTNGANGGFYRVYVDGAQVLEDLNANMTTFTFFTNYGVWVGEGYSASGTNTEQPSKFDDIYIMEIDGVEHTEPLGPVRVFGMTVNSDETPNDWAPSTGSDNYAVIDNEDWETADYVEGDVTADDDHYGVDNTFPVTPIAVHGVRVDVVCEATDGTPNLHIGFDDGTADEEDKGTIATGGEVQKTAFFDKDPSGSDWTATSLGSVEATQRMTE